MENVVFLKNYNDPLEVAAEISFKVALEEVSRRLGKIANSDHVSSSASLELKKIASYLDRHLS